MIDAFGPPASSAPGDSGREGYSGAAAHADHVHPREAADANLSGTPTTSAVGDAAATGTSTTGAHSDHRHGREAFATTADIADIAGTESAGTAATVARGDHVHADTAFTGWTSYTPSWTSTGTAPAIGNGAVTGFYKQVGKTVHIRVLVQMNTTTTFGTGSYQVSLPAGMTTPNNIEHTLHGRCSAAGINYPLIAVGLPNDTKWNLQSPVSNARSDIVGTDATHPATFTATASNYLDFAGTFEIQ